MPAVLGQPSCSRTALHSFFSFKWSESPGHGFKVGAPEVSNFHRRLKVHA